MVTCHLIIFYLTMNGMAILLVWKKSKFATPAQDIVGFYSRSLNTYPIARSDRFEWFQMYHKKFPFYERRATTHVCVYDVSIAIYSANRVL